MGANLGEGGRVRFETCIECPFHGWAFDGETGACILPSGDKKIPRSGERYEYYDIEKCTPIPNDGNTMNTYLEKVGEQEEIKIKKYTCREINGSILVWYHSDESLRENPLYEPFDLTNELKVNKMEGKKRKEKKTMKNNC